MSQPSGPAAWMQRARELGRAGWDWAVIAVLSVGMFVVRMRTFGAYRRDEATFFIGTDPYYHARQILYSVDNFPSTLGYDAMTQYPLGTDPGQFGTLFDQIGAALAWLVGLVVDGGHPSTETLMDVIVAYPAVLGALILPAVYLLARELVPRGPALFTALIVAILPGEFLIRSLAGYTDHHVIEALLSTLAVWATLRALRAWEESTLTVQDLLDEPSALWDGAGRRPALVSLGAAVAFAAYLWAWPSGVLFIGIVGAWIVLDTTLETARGRQADAVALTGIAVFLPLALIMLFHDRAAGFTALNYSWMQPSAALLVALAGASLILLGRLWSDRELPRAAFPLAVLGLGLAGLALFWVLAPGLVQNVLSGASWVTGIGVERTRLTIAEAQPAEIGEMYAEFGLLFWTGALGLVLVAWDAIRGNRRGDTLLILWALLMTSASLTQVRFVYYLAIVVALLNGELAHKALNLARRVAQAGSRSEETADVRGAQIFVALILLLSLVPVHATGFTDECRGELNAWSLGDCFQPGEEWLWHTSLLWMRESTPELPISLATQFEPPPPGQRFDYPEGTYGVLSWWDYGHQIEFEAERPPIANPFQQQAPLAAEIFTAPSEEAALAPLDDYLGQGNQARYLAVDNAMVAGKYGAITVWAEVISTYQDYARANIQIPGGGSAPLPVLNEQVRGWFLQDLFYSDASGYEHLRLVHESERFSLIGNIAVRTDQGLQPARINRIINQMSAQAALDQIGDLNFRSGNQALRLGGGSYAYDVALVPSLKIYERVPGAELTGTSTPGAQVNVSLTLQPTGHDRTITYRAQTKADGSGRYQLTVPYSTTAYLSPEEGGTATQIQATGPYTVETGGTTRQVEVPDRAVLEGRTVQVGLT